MLRRRTITLATTLIMAVGPLCAQLTETTDKKHFNHLDVGVTAGSTGFGFDLSMPVGEYVNLRAGAAFMPHFTKDMHFGVQVGDDDPTKTAEENRSIQNQKFNRLAEILEGFTGYAPKNNVTMVGEPSFNQFKLMADIHPFKNNKNWHFTAGFYIGNHHVANAFNTREDMPSLMAVKMYNKIYWNVIYEQSVFSFNGSGMELEPWMNQAFKSYGSMSYAVGKFKHDFYATQDMYYDHNVYAIEIQDKDGNIIQEAQFVEDEDDPNFGNYVLLHKKGDLQYRKGDLVYKAGEEYRMTPDDNMMVKAKAFVNTFRPYIGFGYGGPITKDKRTTLSFDCGAIFWGGKPSIITQDGVDMVRDLTDVNGQVGHYLNIIKSFPVYPVLEIRIAHTIF